MYLFYACIQLFLFPTLVFMNSEAHLIDMCLVHSWMLELCRNKIQIQKVQKNEGLACNRPQFSKVLTFRFQERLYNFHPSQTAKAADASYFLYIAEVDYPCKCRICICRGTYYKYWCQMENNPSHFHFCHLFSSSF